MRHVEQTGLRAILCATAVALAGAALPAPALADDDGELPVAEATDVVGAIELETVADAADDALEAVAQELDQVTTGEGPTPEAEPEMSESPEAGEPAPESGDSAPEAASTPDTTGDNGDTAGDSADQAAPTDDGTSTTTPAGSASPAGSIAPAVNVNVSVRIGSAGDNGAVTQENASTSRASERADTAAPARTEAGAAAPPAPDSSAPDTWYWEWDCLSAPNIPVVSPTDSGGDSIPNNWTWIWNCPGNQAQYQDALSQYQQINANVAIRISSPGDNGPVSQTNIAITTGAGKGNANPSRAAAPAPAPSLSLTIPPVTISTVTVGITLPRVVIDVAGILSGVPAIDVATDVGLDVEVADGVAVANDMAAGIVDLALGSPSSDIPGRPRAGISTAPGVREPGSDPRGVTATFGAAQSSATLGAAVLAQREARPSGARPHPKSRARPAPRWTPADDATAPRAPAPAPTGTSASAAGAGGSSGGGLPIFLALPFLAAMLDLARRVALERVTWPSGHRRRVPDTPG